MAPTSATEILARCPRLIADEDSQTFLRDPYVSVFRGVGDVAEKGCVKRELDKPVNDVSAEVEPLSKRLRWARGVLRPGPSSEINMMIDKVAVAGLESSSSTFGSQESDVGSVTSTTSSSSPPSTVSSDRVTGWKERQFFYLGTRRW